ncbi:DegT/DnrJ/EryC1/StrS family aminotransferase [Elusimicrobiota bacterium]
MKKIQMVDLQIQYKYLKKDIFKRWKKLCSSSSFILGEEVCKFEEEFARYCNRKYAIGVSSGTSAIHLALVALNAKDRHVISTPLTFIATNEAIIHAGAKIKWVDVDPHQYVIDPDAVASKVSQGDIILPVHLYGHMADMEIICAVAKEHNLKIVEDCAQAHGAEFAGRKAGSAGDIGCFSFYPGKNLGAYGDAGAVVCDDSQLAEMMKRLRTHGSTDKYYHTEIGYNYRLDALQAAVLRIKLKYLDEWNQARREKAALYNECLADLPVVLPKVHKKALHVYHQYVILASERDKLKEKLSDDGISTAVHYPVPLNLQPAFKYMGCAEGSFPKAEQTAKECLSLPMCPELKTSQIQYISDKIREFYAG